jgi:L-2-hydroxyglutarate oxidase LhgO
LCLEHGIPITDKGKVIVARQEGEQAVLEELCRLAQANGVQASLIDEQTLRELEPCARTLRQALYVATTAVVDPEQVMEALVAMALREGVAFRYGCAWQGVGRNGVVETSQGQISCGYIVNCAGLYADRIARAYGVGRHYRILPFRGRFYGLRGDSTVRVNGNIYPVPDLRNPFLGVHLTRRPNGSVIVGPSALPVLGREHYAGLQGVTRADAVAMIGYLGRLLSTNPDHFRSLALGELAKLPRLGFYREAARLVDGLKPHDLLPGPAPGIRAQLVDTRTAKLVSDFVVEEGPRSTHVLNAVSPAFTCALPFAEYVVDLMTLGRGAG